MTLRFRLNWIAGLLLAFLVCAGSLAIVVSQLRSDAIDKHRRIGVALEQVLRLETAYVNMQTGGRGFLIDGGEEFLKPFTSGRANVDSLQASLLAADSPLTGRMAQALLEVVTAGNSWRTTATSEIDLRRAEGSSVAREKLTGQVAKDQFDLLRTNLRSLQDRLTIADEKARVLREDRTRQSEALLLAFPVVALLFAVATGVLVNRWVAQPSRSMVDAVRLVTAGNLESHVPSLGAADVAELGANIDAMRQTMSDRLLEAVRAKREADRARLTIEENALATLQLRTELASKLGSFPVGWTAAADLYPAEGWAAGDCYDVTLVSPDTMGVIVLDIAGHGPAQAVIALKCKEILRAALRVGMAPGDGLSLLADQVGDIHPSFLSAFVALVDTRSGVCSYANAGHPPALAEVNRRVVELEPTGPLVGIFPATWRTDHVQIPPGGKLVVYTDGLSEARNANREFYGIGRLSSLLVDLPDQEAEPLLKACLEDLRNFSPTALKDDVSMVLICRSGENLDDT